MKVTGKKKKKTLPESTKEVLTHQAADKQNEHHAKEKRKRETVQLIFNSRQLIFKALPVK